MYIPPEFNENDESKMIAFMQAHNFANLISSSNDLPIATHLPFLIEKREGKLFLIAHMAKANPQWKTFLSNELLIIFQGPHAYISPTNYEKQQNVPTWNYMAVHVYGKAKLIDDGKTVINLMEKTIHTFETEFFEQWKNLSTEYINGMLKAIVAFEIEVIRMEGQFKLSQNKTKNEQQKIIASFEKSNDTQEKGIATEMKNNLNNK